MAVLTNVYSQDRRLTTFQKYQGNDLSAFIALQVAPVLPVDRPTFKYYVFGKDHMRAYGNTRRGEGSEGIEVDFKMDSLGVGTADEYAVSVRVPREVSQFADEGLNILPNMARFLQQLMYVDIETRFKTVVTVTSNHKGGTNSVTLSGTSKWSDYTNSTPLLDVQAGREAIRKSVGFYPNWAWMSPTVWRWLKFHPQIINAIKYTGRGIAKLEDLQTLFEIPNILIASSRVLSSVWGTADVLGDLWDDSFYMVYSGPNPSPMTPMSIPYGWHASRPIAGYPNLREVAESKYLDGPVIDQSRQRYSYTFNQVSMTDGGSYKIDAAV